LHDAINGCISHRLFLGTTLEQKLHAVGEWGLSDETIRGLIRRIEAGDSSALLTLYDGTSRLVFGLLLRILGDRTSAEEALLEVYTQVWKQPTRCDPERMPLAWLVKISHDGAVSRMNWSKRDGAKLEIARVNADSPTTVAPRLQNLTRASLQSMAYWQRVLLESAYYGCLSCSELAARIGKPIGAVKEHIRLGLSRLGESFGPADGREVELEIATGGDLEARKSD
jgi:RNA polymerase sigma-70 factor (ECF subfamily)